MKPEDIWRLYHDGRMISSAMMDMIIRPCPDVLLILTDKPMVRWTGKHDGHPEAQPTSDHTPRLTPPPPAGNAKKHAGRCCHRADLAQGKTHRKKTVVVNRPAMKAHNE